MSIFGNRRSFTASLGVLAIVTGAQISHAQANRELTRGFETTLAPTADLAEINAQDGFWILEVSFKPMRMIWVDVTDPRTGKTSRELVWYLMYKAVNRPLERRQDDSDTEPRNVEDPLPRPLFIPEFTLVTNDGGRHQVYQDVVIPEAQRAILEREQRPGDRFVCKNPVEIVGEVPEVTPADARTENALYGIVMWRAVDATTDDFTVYMTGFSSGYKIAKLDGRNLPWRKTIMQEFWRPGDEFLQREIEIRRKGDPQWIYRPDPPHLVSASSEKPAPKAANGDRNERPAAKP